MDIWWTVLFAIVMDESTLKRFQRLAIIFGRDHVCVYFGLLGTNTEFIPLCSLKIEVIGAGFGFRVSGNEHEKLVPAHFMPVFLGFFNRCFKVQRCPAQVRAPSAGWDASFPKHIPPFTMSPAGQHHTCRRHSPADRLVGSHWVAWAGGGGAGQTGARTWGQPVRHPAAQTDAMGRINPKRLGPWGMGH